MQNQPRSIAVWGMLFSRSALFFFFQVLIALLLAALGLPNAWHEAPRWWPFAAAFTNLVSIFLLVRLFRAEGRRYWDLLRFSRQTLGEDLLWLLGALVIGLPVAAAPMTPLAAALFGDANIPVQMMFRPMPAWALAAAILFPLTIGFAELPTYFGYVMPRLTTLLKNGWAAWLLAALLLGLQHCFLPFIADGRFLLWRAGMYLPFALFVGLVLKLRPRMMPYMAIIHALMDFSALAVYFTL